MLSGPVQRLGFLVNLAATASASASRVFEIIDTPNEIEVAIWRVSFWKTRGETCV